MIVTHLLSAGSLLGIDADGIFRFAILLALIISAFYHVRSYWIAEDDDFCELGYEHGQWHLTRNDGVRVEVMLTNDLVVLSFLVVMSFVDQNGRRHLLPILRDSTSRQGFRHLKVLLNFGLDRQPNLGGTR